MSARTAGLTLQRRTAVLAAGLSVLAILAILTVAMLRGRPAEDASASAPGAVPAASLPLIQGGGTFNLADHTNGPVLMYFWASWCQPCLREAPIIQRLYPEYQAKGYTFVGVNIWDAQADAQQFVTDQQLTFPTVSDPGGKTYMALGVQQLPAAFVMKPGLTIDQKFVGELTEEKLRELLDHAGGR